MKYITEKLEQFIELGYEIMNQLKAADPSLDTVQQLMQQRNDIISALDDLIEHLDIESITPEEEAEINHTFQKIRELQAVMNPALQKLLNEQKEMVGDATRRRKADDQYHLLETPDISYFSDK